MTRKERVPMAPSKLGESQSMYRTLPAVFASERLPSLCPRKAHWHETTVRSSLSRSDLDSRRADSMNLRKRICTLCHGSIPLIRNSVPHAQSGWVMENSDHPRRRLHFGTVRKKNTRLRWLPRASVMEVQYFSDWMGA